MAAVPLKSIFIYGPTASGKSGLALELADKFGGVIVNCDSRQIYTDLGIGAAKPSAADRARVPHALYDVVSAPITWSVGDYHRAFFEWWHREAVNHRVIFVVGGTGFYFQALQKGLWQIPKANLANQEMIEARLASEGEEPLYRDLAALDPRSALKISSRDHYRLVRFLEIFQTTGKTVSEHRLAHEKNPGSRFPSSVFSIYISPERSALHRRIEDRTRHLFAAGFVDEVQMLNQRNLGAWAPLNSVGYREIATGLAGNQSTAEMIESVSRATKQLAKKQRTWFQRENPSHIFRTFEDAAADLTKYLRS